jgi:hypothetical protein
VRMSYRALHTGMAFWMLILPSSWRSTSPPHKAGRDIPKFYMG